MVWSSGLQQNGVFTWAVSWLTILIVSHPLVISWIPVGITVSCEQSFAAFLRLCIVLARLVCHVWCFVIKYYSKSVVFSSATQLFVFILVSSGISQPFCLVFMRSFGTRNAFVGVRQGHLSCKRDCYPSSRWHTVLRYALAMDTLDGIIGTVEV